MNQPDAREILVKPSACSVQLRLIGSENVKSESVVHMRAEDGRIPSVLDGDSMETRRTFVILMGFQSDHVYVSQKVHLRLQQRNPTRSFSTQKETYT